MKANQAAELSRQNQTTLLNVIYEAIMTQARKGSYQVILNRILPGDVEDQLITDGYRVIKENDTTTIIWYNEFSVEK